ncbi:MAG: serine/threonine protein kinase [Acidobacteriota bacterium]|nr:serine/threonine protein kinase [Acidobacteriota bacterium]
MTDDAFWEQVRTLFHEASERDTAARAELLRGAEPAVRAEVESLLSAHDEPTPFLEKSVWQLIDAQQGERLAGSLLGPYRIVRQLGRGGMGTVFLATREDADFEQRVAIKLVRGGEMLVQRFRQERQILASLEHPNIARLIDGGTTTDGLPYLVMEYVDGTTIDTYCRTHALSIPAKLHLFLQLCDAVEHAHRALIIHRDIKPANVLVTAEGVPKLLDFGIAKLTVTGEHLDATATRIWTPQYASPEQLLGRVVTTATDVYSLGVLLFELLSGRKPFDAETRLPNTEAPPPSSVADELALGAASIRALRGEIDDIVLASLEVDPAVRYGSVDKFADDVRRYLTGHPIAARRSTFGYRASKFVRRNFLSVAAAVLIVVVTAIAFAATLHQKRIAERRFDEVRSLARAVVFELHDAIAPLPGSTPARELLVRRALVYLDKLAAESQDNTLRLELAGAYLKIGDVQGLPYQANLGNTAGAAANYRKALDIAQAAAANEPENPEILTLVADAHDRVGFVEQRALRWADALRQHEAARAIREKLPHDIRHELAMAQTWTAIGDCRYIGVGANVIPREILLGTAQEAYEAALATLRDLRPPPELRSKYLQELGRANQRLGGFYTGGVVRDHARSLRHHDAALRALGERAALEPDDAVARRNYADQFAMKATLQNRSGDWAGALDSTAHALKTFKTLAADDPDNVEAQHDLAFAHGEQGIALMSLKRFDEAQTALREAISIRERLIMADPENQEDRRDLKRVQSLLFEMEQMKRGK